MEAMPESFAPTEKHLSYARKFGHDRRWVMNEIERCRNWHSSKGMVRSNWNSVVNNWLIKAVEYAVGNENKTHFKSGDSGWSQTAAKPDLAMAGIVKYARINPSYARHLLNLQSTHAQRAILGAVPEDVREVLER